jgi:hypothetical protein
MELCNSRTRGTEIILERWRGGYIVNPKSRRAISLIALTDHLKLWTALP